MAENEALRMWQVQRRNKNKFVTGERGDVRNVKIEFVD